MIIFKSKGSFDFGRDHLRVLYNRKIPQIVDLSKVMIGKTKPSMIPNTAK